MEELKQQIERLKSDAEIRKNKYPADSWRHEEALGEIKAYEKVLKLIPAESEGEEETFTYAQFLAKFYPNGKCKHCYCRLPDMFHLKSKCCKCGEIYNDFNFGHALETAGGGK